MRALAQTSIAMAAEKPRKPQKLGAKRIVDADTHVNDRSKDAISDTRLAR